MGSIFRTADAAGVAKVYLSGYTPRPTDRFGRAQKEIAKTALGAERFLEWEYMKLPSSIIKVLRKEKWEIVGVEQDTRAVQYEKFKLKKPTLFIFGNEVHGISSAVRARCDYLVEISMHGKKESLNVGVAAGIILFSVR